MRRRLPGLSVGLAAMVAVIANRCVCEVYQASSAGADELRWAESGRAGNNNLPDGERFSKIRWGEKARGAGNGPRIGYLSKNSRFPDRR